MSCRQQSCRKLLDGSLWHQLALAHPVMASRSPSCFAICLRSLLVWDSSAPNRDFIVLMRLSNWDPSPFDLLMQPRFQLCHVRPQPTVAGPDYPGQGSYNPKAKMAIIFPLTLSSNSVYLLSHASPKQDHKGRAESCGSPLRCAGKNFPSHRRQREVRLPAAVHRLRCRDCSGA